MSYEDMTEDIKKNLAYEIAEGVAEIMPGPSDEIRSMSEFPHSFLVAILDALHNFQPKYMELQKQMFTGISTDTEYGSALGVVVPLIGGRYLSFVVQAPETDVESGDGKGQVLYIFMVDISAINEDESNILDGKIAPGFFICQRLVGDGMNLNDHLSRLVEAFAKQRLEETHE